MGVRIATGIVLIALVVLWLFFADYAVFTMGALLIYMVGAYEMGPLLKFKSRIPFLIVAAVAATLMFMVAPPGEYVTSAPPVYMQYLVLLALPFWCVAVMLVKAYPHMVKWHDQKWLNCIVALLMLLPFLQGLLMMRAVNFSSNYYEGAYLVISVMALVWAADSGAYFTGRMVGKTPLMPEVSPKKTREGALGGVVFAIVVMYLAKYYGFYSIYGTDELAFLVAAFGAIIFSIFGDLMESVLKRLTGIKDSGKIFPGHGGMLDRIDSQLAAIPVFLSLYWLVSGELFHAAAA
ncbi:MAG TPA: phosphatidate cytidylyltransferase [Candidatus Anaerobiospirillum pullistercoris]|uniref:Phosphatidate cytidylyltransferase n=1 Tax=Candidatus Anaerobiospirillum pullistercoris TaxID=2838452 RepID=A0A9D1WB12_9GAMM|nr:phosphatidate cytidylyltransferase [Candidatus Anaerobiospirillum pullistercoris]